MDSQYDNWNSVKKKIAKWNHKPPHFKEGDIWWIYIGYNLGHEIYGKGPNFVRPVLIIRKFNRFSFIGIPLSKTLKRNPYYTKISISGRTSSAILSQIRTFSSMRLSNKIGELDSWDFSRVNRNLIALLKLPPSNKGGSRG